ncbi:hypothetical protein OG884_23640 [Streptosporangium sp. NBC_01755]|uniref:hypothetical protein n=1 Tax=unclassified Streptosporangium TaxID=2632669 RepID=UPI002DD8E53F|nr:MULTISPECIES: hypothetical protein [unclassified Streptosporangium]WSA24051.1 hypothetical protein OIE13_24285 [Streptosporangium sp. NBC_01810]WSC97877.1 hypothetical protein OG884_23640 [Streptosporangium sp. NBC_01755]
MGGDWGETAKRFAPALLGLLFGLLALGPALGPGFVLRYDMVFVPDPPPVLPGEGFPRAVPSDLVVAFLSWIVPEQVVQKVVLLGIFVLAASGAATLVPSGKLGPRLAAAAFYTWNAYLAQRLLLGQWALLLGVAGLPWAVRAVALGGRSRLVAALLPAAVGGFQAMLVAAPALLATAATAPGATASVAAGGTPASVVTGGTPAPGAGATSARRVRVRRVVEVALVMAVLSLPWLVPALSSRAVTDPAGAWAFAARADGPLGTVGSLLSLGGIWNAHAVLPGQETWWSAIVRLVLAAVAVWGFFRLSGSPAPHGAGAAKSYRAGLAVAAVAGLAVALAGAFAPGALGGLIGWWPGFGPLRDGQLYLAPFVLLQAVGLAAVVARWNSRAVAAVAVAVPILVLPTFALGVFGRLSAVDYPDEWREVQAIVNADPAPGALLSLPWGAHRAFGWNGHRVILDPATKMFRRRVLWNDALLVGLPGGGRLRVGAESPASAAVEAALGAEPGGRMVALAGLNIRYVLIYGGGNSFHIPGGGDPFHGSTTVFQGHELRLLRLEAPA